MAATRLRTALASSVSMASRCADLDERRRRVWSRRPALLDPSRATRLRLNRVEVLVLDEADRCSTWLIDDIRRIVAKLPAQSQTLLSPATCQGDRRSRGAHAAQSGQVAWRPSPPPPTG